MFNKNQLQDIGKLLNDYFLNFWCEIRKRNMVFDEKGENIIDETVKKRYERLIAELETLGFTSDKFQKNAIKGSAICAR